MPSIAFLILGLLGQHQSPPALPPIDPQQARLEQTISSLDAPGSALAYSERLGMLALGSDDGAIQVWDRDVLQGIRSGGRTSSVLHGHAGAVLALAWNDGPFLASAGSDRKVMLWSMPDGKISQTIASEGLVRALALAPGGKVLAAAGDDGSIVLFDTATAKSVGKLEGHRDWVIALTFSHDGKLLASGGYDGQVKIWDVASRKLLNSVMARAAPSKEQPTPVANAVRALAFSHDDKIVAVGGTDTLIHLLQTSDGKLVRSMSGHASSVTALGFHPGGAVLASASKDRTVRLWDAAKGTMLKSLEGHSSWVQGAAFVAAGTRLASVSADRTLRIWNLSPVGK
jgi:hypothetical protein